ncbi:cytochrome c biogenesis protein ResB [Luteolibacter algae]|uniref:Cytochrome c biogenesis protein ResB n=1 Tax=Luteolibacter algae TaxID=454151 RepID=A0ABW5D9I7_9BACT
MEQKQTTTVSRKQKSVFGKVYDFLSGFPLATVTLLLLLVLTWLATLEQIDHGLYPTLNKYFSWKSLFFIPEINGKKLPVILPGGYYVSAVLLINMTLGGIIRIRKGPKHYGNLISHFGIVFMLLGGGVAHHFSDRGNMAVGEGETSNAAEDYFEFVVEVSEVKDGKRELFHVIRGNYLTDLVDGKTRTFEFEGIPFSLEVSNYLKNAQPVNQFERPPALGEYVADNYYLAEKPSEVNAETNFAGAYARAIFPDGKKTDPFIVAGASFYPFTIRADDRIFTIDMRKRLWIMPFEVKLDKFDATFHPGTSRPAKFVSDIRRVENGQESKVRIQMNEPMRYEGFTFFQASYGPPGAGSGDRMYSVFEVVKNPADKWPEYSLYVVAFGMLVTFLTKLGGHLGAASRKRKNEA